MKQAWLLLCAIFSPLGGLVAVLRVVLDFIATMDGILADPEQAADMRTHSGRKTLEGAIAFAETWINIVIAARAVEMLGLPRHACRFETRWTGWTPSAPRTFDSLMQRYERMRAALYAVERLARRRAAQIRRAMAADPLGLDAASTIPECESHALVRPLAPVCAGPARLALTLPIRAPPELLISPHCETSWPRRRHLRERTRAPCTRALAFPRASHHQEVNVGI